MKESPQGISNRETADEEATERDVLGRDEETVRDRAGHVDRESTEEALQNKMDERAQAPEADDKRGADWRRSRSGS